jgi:hypothetical protein
MPHEKLDRFKVRMKPLAERDNKIVIERDHVPPTRDPRDSTIRQNAVFQETIERIRAARAAQRPVMLTFGAHTIKNGMGPTLIRLLEEGWVTHTATNGAGIIHDWEFAFQGQSSEDVRVGVARGEFGNWRETGFYINLALNVGAYEGKGYGESVGAMIESEGLDIPSKDDLLGEIADRADPEPERAAAAADLLSIVRRFDLPPGRMEIPHPWKRYSAQAAAYRLGVPCTGHPMIGHDIIYNHPMNHGASIGRVALRDFLTFANAVRGLDGGVYLSVGSAVMSPMVFEKSMSMAQNLAIQEGRRLENYYILVADLAESRWDWRQGEPPQDNPDYYLRYNKSFSRMGGEMRYITADNRDLLLALCQELGARRSTDERAPQ